MNDYSSIFDALLQNQDHFTDAHDKPTVLEAQSLVIEFSTAFRNIKRAQRLQIMSDLVGRKILTTKDLRVGEIKTLTQMLNNRNFVRDMIEEYGIQMKEQKA